MQYLIWANEHHAWWRADYRGYTELIEEAGRYTRTAAEAIVANATVDGALTVQRTNPVTGMEYTSLSEYMVLAPERTEPATPPVPPADDRPPRPLTGAQVSVAIWALTADDARRVLHHLAYARPVEFAGAVAYVERQRPATCGGGCGL